jgi:hypothetical protein
MLTSCGGNDLPPYDPNPETEGYAVLIEAAEETIGVYCVAECEAIEEHEPDAEQVYTIEEYEPDAEQVYTLHRTDIAQAGDLIEFGGYSWQVLEVYGEHALIITENVIVMHRGGRFHYRLMDVTWESSSLRQYLNSEFLNSFCRTDRARIRETYIVNNDSPWFRAGRGGNNTLDRIFILNAEEVVRYFGDSGQLRNRPDGMRWISDEYNSERIAENYDGAPMWWWLRTPGQYQRLGTGVDVAGFIFLSGTGVGNTGGGIRPALWLNLVSPWDYENFSDIREPLHFDYDTPHGDLANRHLNFISENLYSRIPFSYREKEAAVWLVEELLAMGHNWNNIQVQEIPLTGEERWWNLNNLPRWASDIELRETTRLTQNVVLTIPGQSAQTIIVGAHYDSWPTSGTSDNASGMSVLLESAQRVIKLDNYYTIKYVFLGAHELGGFLASDFFINSLTYEQESNVVLMINVDNLIDGPYLFFGAAYNDDFQPGSNAITQRIDEIAYELDLGLIGYPPAAFHYSDQISFIARNHTVVFLFGLTGVEHPGVVGFLEIDGKQFIRGVSHAQNDDFHYIEARWPGRIQTNLRTFSIFLEEMLMMR